MKTQCPNCRARFNVNDKFSGKQAKCPKCANPFTIEPFMETPVETPVVVETPEPPAPVAQPVKIPEPVVPPVKAAVVVPTKSAIPTAPPVKNVEPAKETKASSKALSKTLFVYCWITVRIITGVLAGLGILLAIRKSSHSALVGTFAAADIFLVCSVAIELLLFYKMWVAIQDNQASTSPGKAIGFLLIPVFNIYWALLILTGFPEDYNSFIHRRSVKAKDLSFMLFLIYAFAFILASIIITIPMIFILGLAGLINRVYVGYHDLFLMLLVFASVVGVFHFIAYILFATKTCNAVNALSEPKGG